RDLGITFGSRRLRLRRHGKSTASLHAKTVAVDAVRVFVGSLQLDPRSIRLNTEMGLVIESPSLAAAVIEEFDHVVVYGAYEVVLAADGGGVRCVEATPG